MGIVTTNCDSVPTTSRLDWRGELRRAIRDPIELCRRLELPDSLHAEALRAARSFPLLAPIPFVEKMAQADAADPLLRQVLPLGEELIADARYTHDPLSESAASLTPGLLQKYSGRALLVTTGACAVHCRYCFRRHFPYNEVAAGERWDAAIRQINEDATVEEVLLSGGDPWMLDDDLLSELVFRIESIPHVRRLRFHTRLPVVIPSRVDSGLLAWFERIRAAKIVVLHANHARELDDDLARAVERLQSVGAIVLNQAVLLAGVNDSVSAQFELCQSLIEINVLPYYLHQLDRVAGAAHFDTQQQLGIDIVAALRERLPGYAVPRFVQEVAGAPHKIVIA